MAGRIRDEDVALVRERANLADVIGEHVTLRNAGAGSLKGLCPFHDEKSPSFHVTPSRGFFYCFGCQAGGDVIDFLRRIDHLSFAEAVEWLAGRTGVQLRYEEGGSAPGRQQGQRTRLLEAHRAAAEFYAERLATGSDAAPGQRFLSERGFDAAAAERFGVGYAPREWDLLSRHLRGRGFSEAELLAGGLTREGSRGPIDRFRGRLMWPIRDLPGDVVGFGARRLYDDDTGPKYLNTPDTPLYKKSQVLYGVDLAKRDIARRMQAVLVEGYTDVMACHLSGVETAVATCGTAFGEEHIKLVRRLLNDQNEFRGEVVFTFDGDEAGQKAALKAFADDQRFVAQTFVAVQPDGLDPCELRQLKGPEAVRDLIARRVPMFEFAIRGALSRFDLNTPEGRIGALRAAAPLVAGIRDRSLRPEYSRTLAGWLGIEVEVVTDMVGRSAAASPKARPVERPADAPPAGSAEGSAPQRPSAQRPDPNDPALAVEREALKVALQAPGLTGSDLASLEPTVFTAPAYVAVHAAIAAASAAPGGAVGAAEVVDAPARRAVGEAWVVAVREAAANDAVRALVAELAVEPPRAEDGVDARYATAVLSRLEELSTTRRIVEVKSRLQRLNPVEQVELYNRLFGELVSLEAHRRLLRERAIGTL